MIPIRGPEASLESVPCENYFWAGAAGAGAGAFWPAGA